MQSISSYSLSRLHFSSSEAHMDAAKASRQSRLLASVLPQLQQRQLWACQRLSSNWYGSWAPWALIKLMSTSQDSENFAAFYISLHWRSTGESRLTHSNLLSYSPFSMFIQRVGFSSGWGYTLGVKENTKSHNWINGTKSSQISFVHSSARFCSSSMHRLWQLQKPAPCFLHSFALSLLF